MGVCGGSTENNPGFMSELQGASSHTQTSQVCRYVWFVSFLV